MLKTIRLLAEILLFAVFVGISNLPARACSCEHAPVVEELGRSDAVFVGKVVGAKTQKLETNDDGNQVSFDVGEIYLEVEEAFRGTKVGERITIHSGTGGGDCGFWFSRGEKYLVFASQDHPGELWTSICQRTSILGHTQPDWTLKPEEDLIHLRQVFQQDPRAEVGGRCEMDDPGRTYNLKIAGLRILLESDQTGEIRETRADAKGNFRFPNVPAGTYTLLADIPSEKFNQKLIGGRNGKVVVFDRGRTVVSLVFEPRSP